MGKSGARKRIRFCCVICSSWCPCWLLVMSESCISGIKVCHDIHRYVCVVKQISEAVVRKPIVGSAVCCSKEKVSVLFVNIVCQEMGFGPVGDVYVFKTNSTK